MTENPYAAPAGKPTKYSSIRNASPMLRWVAALVDLLLVMLFVFLYSRLMILLDTGGHPLGLAILGVLIFLYEPVMVSQFKGSLGHKFFRLQVVAKDGKSNVALPWAIFRLILKSFLGLISFFWILGRRRQALHDILTYSMVIRK